MAPSKQPPKPFDPSNPFDWINAINSHNDPFKDASRPEDIEKGYTPFMVNRGLSYFPETVLYANEMNMNAHLDKRLQFQFLLNSVRPGKRFSKWAKKKESGDLEVVMEYFGYSLNKAREALSVLTKEQLEAVKAQTEKGGKK